MLQNTTARVGLAFALVLGGFSLSGCATEKYVDEHVAALSTRIDSVDAKASDGIQRADAAMSQAQAANSAAQAANSAAQAAAADARTANQRVDQLTGQVQQLQSMPATGGKGKKPRG
jgi:outer membrane murein-binding lipoprotein Lpp